MTRNIPLSEIRAIFEAVIDLPLAERAAHLDATCESPEIRARIEEMLAVNDKGNHWMDPTTSIDVSNLFTQTAGARIPEKIGHCVIRRRIATGGMGTVYEAEQENPRRIVAVKVMLRRLMHREAARRFHEEVRILGHLKHQAIAQIYEADVHRDDGDDLPYFVMEYVPGATSITDYCRRMNLDIRERIELFIKVCEGVHHGHQKGVIHRDLKPDNILVDESGQPKIIDFGVARSTDSDIALTTMQTNMGQIIGTIQYMSPEQLDGDPHEIDTRSDVYTLGLVLYELLTGQTPHDVHNLPMPQALQVLREARPPRLSAVVAKLRGDLETIVSRAMERDRERRYQSALELAQDLGRYLTGDAISARPPSLVYHVRVMARRHRAAAMVLTGMLMVIVASSAATTILYWQTDRARIETAAQRDKAQAIEAFLSRMLTGVAPPSPDDEIAYRVILDEASRMIDNGDLARQPLTEVEVRRILAGAYASQNLYADAIAHLEVVARLCEQTLGPEDRETLSASLAILQYTYLGGLTREGAGELARHLFATCQRVLPPDDRMICDAAHKYALFTQTLDSWRQWMEACIAFDGADSASAHVAMHVYGMTLAGYGGNPKEGRRYQEQALAYFMRAPAARKSFGTAENATRQFLSITYRFLGLFDQAETVLAPMVPLIDEYRRGDRPHWLFPAQTLWIQARVIAEQGRLDEIMASLPSDIALVQQGMGNTHETAFCLTIILGDALRETGQLEEATDIAFKNSLSAFEKDPTGERGILFHRLRAGILFDEGMCEQAQFEMNQCLSLIDAERAKRARNEASTTFYDDMVQTWLLAAEIAHAGGRNDDARALLEPVMHYYDEKCEPIHPNRARARRLIGSILAGEGNLDDAEKMYRTALAIDLEFRGPGHRETAKSHLALGRFLLSHGRVEEARPELEEARRILSNSPFIEGLWLRRVEAAVASITSR